ncbi:DUF1150 domain-containing protein [Cognatishimia sp. F0-27]|uniref:DUF1150 family protein n=1 Tax=Cognatishimia sp. F0-27 TaxID=2816855 RepID=UPI001D0C3BE6|nr:DUF1150 domain-containing protein [Cognatishimia sp. F0-27]MCC1491307.1 DUF1150 domain-containing protein [Cognatishimia sp. F0-27]
MNTRHTFANTESDRIVYVKPVAVADLPEEVQSQVIGHDTLYAVHNADGERLALVKDRNLAFMLARQNDMSPVTVH